MQEQTQSSMRVIGAILAALALAAALGVGQALAKPSSVELEIMRHAKIDLAGAIELAEREVAGRVIEAELDEDDDMFFYKLEVMAQDGLWVVYLNPASAVVVGKRQPGLVMGAVRNHDRAKADAVASAGISMVEALGIAEAHTGGKAIEIEVDRDDGMYIYEVKTIQTGLEHKLDIDLSSGAILDVDVDD